MILKKLFLEFGLPIESILMKAYKELSLSMPQMLVLQALFSIYKKRNTFTMSALSRRLEYSTKEIGTLLDELINKGFVQIELEASKEGKTKEVFQLDGTFSKLESWLSPKEVSTHVSIESIQQLVMKLENKMNRALKPFELEILREWLDQRVFEVETIQAMMDHVGLPFTMKKLEQLLRLQTKTQSIKVSDQLDRALDEVYKKIS
jgi:DNA replication protein DnaD